MCDYVIFRECSEGAEQLDALKLHKLLYYIQAWHLAFYKKPFFEGKFQAWVHGPVNRPIFDRFKDTKWIYTPFKEEDILNPKFIDSFNDDEKLHINTILESYSKFSGAELELMTHKESPWITARKGYVEVARCEVELNEEEMGNYYRARLEANVKTINSFVKNYAHMFKLFIRKERKKRNFMIWLEKDLSGEIKQEKSFLFTPKVPDCQQIKRDPVWDPF